LGSDADAPAYRGLLAKSWPNPYEVPFCQATDGPAEWSFCVCPASGFEGRRSLAACADVIALCWRRLNVAAPHTSRGALTMTMVRAEVSLGRCGRATSWSPQTVLRKGVAEQGPCASSSQARGRGRPRRAGATITVDNGAGAGVQSQGREQGSGAMRSGAFADAVRRAWQRARLRLTPGPSSAAFGAPAPRPTE
jgi:hypothetical protein